jgi:von Willebrand factor type A domain
MDGVNESLQLQARNAGSVHKARGRALAPKAESVGDHPEESRIVWSKILQRFAGRFPWLEAKLEAGLPRDLPAIGVSLVVHSVILAILGIMGIAAHAELKRDITSRIFDNSIPPFDTTEIQDIDQTDLPAVVNPIGSVAPNFSVLAKDGAAPPALTTKPDKSDGPATMLVSNNVSRPGEIAMPSAMTIAQTVAIKGTGAEHVGGVEGAVDRVAMEVLNRLERGKTLVVWAFDESGSMVVEREKLAKHIEQVYTHINQLDENQIAVGDALMTMVVGFGKDRKAMLPEPTHDTSAVIKAIHDVPLDTTGFESTFQTVTNIAKTWGRYKDPKGQHYQTMVIVVTDEVGDDQPQLETAIATASAAKVPVYVLGSSALFGKIKGKMNYTDPKTKKTYYGLEVTQGPESVELETIHLPFWYSGDNYDNLDAGFGPYALQRMAGATGGIYFITRIGTSRLSFDPNAMREYRPDYVSAEQYANSLRKDPIRGAVIQAALITQQQLPGQPGLTFPPADGPEFKEAMARNQETIARIEYTVNEALMPVTAVSKQRDHESSRRWQAHYDLIRGRLLAMKIRCAEYQTACAKMKKDPLKFKDSKSNAWRLAPTEEILSGDKVDKVAKETKALLKRVVEDHPNTPWALLAQRELKDPFGFKWVETYVPPPPPRKEVDAAEAKKKKAEPKKDMPKEPEIRL